MNKYANTKKSKKFILVLVLLILFSFCYPKRAEALLELEDFPAIPAQIFYVAEKGILKYLNNLFTNDEHHTSITTENEEYEAESYSVYLTPENIIKGKFILFDANIFKNLDNSSEYYDDGAFGGAINSGKESLRNVIAGWYYALRNFAIVALLSVLVYIGIRMIMSTIAQDKAKYKVMFKDWLVALCLVVVMHYMMIGILNISSMITDTFGGGENANTIGKLTERISGVLSESSSTNEDGGEDWFDRHYEYTDDEGTYDLGDAYAFILVLGGIIIYTFIFGIKYLKREFTIIFLILLGPVSCITYPIDKISDGKAQAFNKWFSEFLYQVIIQPFHLLLYIVLIGSATALADANVIYALVCFAVMIPAEKFIKSMFGFKDELGSPLGAFAGGALASQLFNKLKGGSSSGKSGKESDSGSSELPVKTKSTPLPGSDGSNATYISEEDKARLPSSDQNNGDDVFIDTKDTSELNEPAEGGMDTSDNLESDESAEGNIYTSNNPESDEQEEGSRDTSGENAEEPEERSKFQKGIDAVRDRYNRKVFKNNGTAGAFTKNLAKKRLSRLGKWALRKTGRTIKGATTLAGGIAGAALLGGIGAMVGQGSKGALAGAGLGGKLGSSVGNFGGKVASKVGDYTQTFYNAARGKDTNKEKYKSNQNNIDRARRNFKDRNGYLGSGDDIDKELENMYYMTTHGVNDSQIEDTMNEYYENMDLYKDIEDQDKREELAMGTAIQSALLAQDYTKKDFNDPKKMEEAYKGLLKAYKNAGVKDDKVADEYVRNIMNGAGKLRGVNSIALPSTNQTVDVSVPSGESMVTALGVANSADFDAAKLQRLNNLTLRLHKEAHMSSREIEKLARGTADSRATTAHVLDTFEAKVEFLTNGDARQQAKDYVAASTKVDAKDVTDKQVKVEMQQRLELLSVGAKKGDMDSIRAVDDTVYGHQTKSEKNMALDIAKKYSERQMNNSKDMDRVIEDLAKDLKKTGTVSDDGIKKATEIAERAANFKGTTITSKYTLK